MSNDMLPARPLAAPPVERRPPIRRPVLAGHLILVLFFGGVLIRLDRTQAEARYDAVRNRYQSLRAAEARLVAEREGHARISFPEELTSERDDPRVAEILAGQEQIFGTRRRSFDGRSRIWSSESNSSDLRSGDSRHRWPRKSVRSR